MSTSSLSNTESFGMYGLADWVKRREKQITEHSNFTQNKEKWLTDDGKCSSKTS